jgi:bacillopeptidase F (M6 metalloprotease family)
MSVWQEVTVDLSSYAGQTITIQFKFDTQDGISNDTEGTYIDNITIFHNC